MAFKMKGMTFGEGTGSSPNKFDWMKKIGKKVDDTVGKYYYPAKSKVIKGTVDLAKRIANPIAGVVISAKNKNKDKDKDKKE